MNVQNPSNPSSEMTPRYMLWAWRVPSKRESPPIAAVLCGVHLRLPRADADHRMIQENLKRRKVLRGPAAHGGVERFA